MPKRPHALVKRAAGDLTRDGWWFVTLPGGRRYGIYVIRGRVKDNPFIRLLPPVRWAIDCHWRDVAHYYKKKGAVVRHERYLEPPF